MGSSPGAPISSTIDVDVYPIVGSEVSTPLILQSTADYNEVTLTVNFKINGAPCLDPLISFRFEEIDFSFASLEYIDIDHGNLESTRCTGNLDGNCGNFIQCLFRDDLVGVPVIEAGDIYTITVTKSEEINDFCTFSLNAELDLICQDPCDGSSSLTYIDSPLSFSEARVFCKKTFGTNLASIIDDDDRNDAISLAPSNDGAWFGLYSGDSGGSGNWRFDNGDQCPSDSSFKCVDFWDYQISSLSNKRPRCMSDDEGGYQCANYRSIDNVIDNDIDCTESKTFYCQCE